MNSFFTNVGRDLDSKIPESKTHPLKYIDKQYQYNIFLKPCEIEETNKIIDKFKNCATGWV